MIVIRKFSVLFFFSILVCVKSVYAQSNCSCTSGSGCSTSQTCPESYIAVCVCQATGCNPSCNRADSEIELSVNTLISKLQNQSAQNIQNILSKAFGKYVEFRPTKSDFTFEFSKSANPADSHWEILEYLAEHGSLKINGYDYDFWKAMRQTLLKGGEFNICTGNAPAKMILAEISFITGKRFSFTAGDPNTKVSVILKGFSLSDILQNLSNASKTTIVEN